MKRLKTMLAIFSIALFLAACASTDGSEEKKDSSTSGNEEVQLVEVNPVVPESAAVPEFAKQSFTSWGNGWNLGNTLDAKTDGSKNNLGLSTEKSWGMPETTQAMIKAVADKGFKTIRVPVSWHNHIVDSNYTIDTKWLERVKTIVDWSLESGMNVIINIHHDNLTEAQMKSNYGFCVPENSAALKEQSLAYIKAVWTQVAAYFKDYGNRLVFEVLNEPRAVEKSYEWYAQEASPDGAKVKAANKIIVEYEQAALDIIRTSGGNNATRYVMIPMYAANPDLNYGWKMPEGENLIVSAHAYTPYEFTMNNKDNFDSSVEADINWLFQNLKKFNMPVIIGEMSASDKNNSADRKKWFEYYCAQAKANEVPAILWDNMVVYPSGDNKAERHGYLNRNKLSWWHEEMVDCMTR